MSFFTRMTALPEELASLVRESETPRNYTIISQTAFDESNSLHRDLMDLEFRYDHENRLSKLIESQYPGLLPKNHLVVDIPSRISFEVNLPILDKGGKKPYIGSPTVFSRPVVQGFTESLRHIKVIVPEQTARKVSRLEIDPFSIP